eukprot:TRINITY_DN2401_c1_g1_i1.p1 TRINITY_DN2401_c1_g1~~TRINITY_DN2401_c1_g1_i1.p1  ORF type:complete len:525 (+),score=159.80 TRINITY_DN2401_c1_g1_i1:125-1699(+)
MRCVIKNQNSLKMNSTRRLGNLERWSVARHNVGVLLNVIVSAKYSVPSNFSTESSNLLKERIRSALKNVIHRHEQLSYVLIDDNTKEPKFKLLDSFDLDGAITWNPSENSEESLEKLLDSQHQKRFETENKDIPLWRIVMQPVREGNVESVWIFFVFHHSFGDGTSGMIFHQSLLFFLQNEAENEEKKTVKELSKPLEECLVVKPGWKKMITTIASVFLLPSWISRAIGLSLPPFWIGEASLEEQSQIKIDVKKGVKNRSWIFYLDSEVVNNLKKVCKQNGVTVTALLSTLISFSVAGTFLDEESDGITLRFNIPINLRRYLREPKENDQMGNFVCGHRFQRDYVLSTSFWNICKEYNSEIHNENERNKAIEEVGMLSYIPDNQNSNDSNIYYNTGWEKFIRDKVNSSPSSGESPRSGSIELSNLGICKVKESKDWNITSSFFSQYNGPTAAALYINSITLDYGSRVGSMGLVANWQEGVISQDKMCDLISLLEWSCKIASEGKLNHETTLGSFLEDSLPKQNN